MRTVHIQPLTHEAFAPFGQFYPMEQPQGYALCGELHRFFRIASAPTASTALASRRSWSKSRSACSSPSRNITPRRGK